MCVATCYDCWGILEDSHRANICTMCKTVKFNLYFSTCPLKMNKIILYDRIAKIIIFISQISCYCNEMFRRLLKKRLFKTFN